MNAFEAPKDHMWILRKQHATRLRDRKNEPGGDKPEWNKTKREATPVPEDIKEFVDKKIKDVLSTTEEGREFLKENPSGLTPRD